MYLHKVKAIHDRLTTNIILNGKKIKSFPLTARIRQGCPVLYFHSTWHWELEVLVKAIRQEERNKGILIGKEKVKLSLFVN